MKRYCVVAVVALVGLSLALPVTGHAWGHGHGWYGAGAFAGGILLGTALSYPFYRPTPVYVYPAPAVVYGPPAAVYVPNRAYVYPDPAITSGRPSPGAWVEVPGQWVNGRWVPPHRAWAPDTP
jgi:hypothetical protein